MAALSACGQRIELVRNGSFEEKRGLPTSWSLKPSDFVAQHWNSPTRGTPDYFSAYGRGPIGVPDNFAGSAYARTGKSYVGIFVGGRKRCTGYREYIQTQLRQPLVKDSAYEVRFFYQVASRAGLTGNRIGLAFIASELNLSHDGVLRLPEVVGHRQFPVAGKWEEVATTYRANGTEKFLVIGNFFDDCETETRVLEGPRINSMLAQAAYVYIDDVSITLTRLPRQSLPPAPRRGYPNDTIQVDSTYFLKKVLFDFDKADIRPEFENELKQLAKVLRQHRELGIRIIGHADPRGSESYNLKLSVRRAEAIARYLQREGVYPEHMIAEGRGKYELADHRQGEDAHARNRRVEFSLYRIRK